MNFKYKTKKGSLLILPSAAFFLCLSIIPLVMLVIFSFINGNIENGTIAGWTFENFVRIFSSFTFSKLMLKSIGIGLLVTVICIILAYPAAWGITKVFKEKNKNTMIMLAIVPFFTSQLLLIYAMMLILQSNGLLMSFLGMLGLVDSSGSILYSTTAVVIVLVYEYLPYMILSLYSAMDGIDNNLIYASHSLGAGRIRTFFNVVLPISLPGLISGIMLVLIPSVGSFVEPALVGGADGMMVGSLINSQFSTVLDMGYGSALSFVFLIILSILMFIIRKIANAANKKIGGIG